MPTPRDTELGSVLLRLARRAIEAHVAADAAARPLDGVAPPFADLLQEDDAIRPDLAPRLTERGATFVTLLRNGALRGCIGSLRAQRPLGEDVVSNAIAAASRDPRFAPLGAGELAELRVEVSLLSAPRFLEFADEADLLRQLRPAVDGLILFSGCRSATFLPQVWQQLPQPHAFLAALKHKAGLAPERAAPDLMAATYTVEKWAEDEAAALAPAAFHPAGQRIA